MGPLHSLDSIRPLRVVEAEYLTWAATRHDGERRALARRLGLSERTLYRKLREAKALLDELETGPSSEAHGQNQ